MALRVGDYVQVIANAEIDKMSGIDNRGRCGFVVNVAGLRRGNCVATVEFSDGCGVRQRVYNQEKLTCISCPITVDNNGSEKLSEFIDGF